MDEDGVEQKGSETLRKAGERRENEGEPGLEG